MTVSATDADTGAPINGAQVLLDGKLVGQTGVAFQFKPVIGQPNPVGLVKEPVAHVDQGFTITLKDPPPRPKGRLFLNIAPTQLIPNTLRLVSAATWTVATLWTPVQTFTTSGANTSVTLPDAPASAPDKRVSVRLATTWEVAGTINGIGFPYQQFPGHLNPDPTFFAWANKDLTAGWLVLWDILTDEDGNALLRVVANYQGAT